MTSELREPDARLIAAAPELLKALRAACEEMGMEDTEWWDDAQAAIAKATSQETDQ